MPAKLSVVSVKEEAARLSSTNPSLSVFCVASHVCPRNTLLLHGNKTTLPIKILKTCHIHIDPPGSPNITGLTNNVILEEGQIKRLTCISMAGNPLADLKWFRGDEEIPGTVTVKGEGGDYSKSDLLITANRTDNGLFYKCHASNPATTESLESHILLKVLFKPAFVKISVEPETPKAGKKAHLTCESGSSNPTARIVWRFKDQHFAGMDASVKKGEYGGSLTTNMLEIEVKPEDHGEVFICEAINDELQESVHNAKTLSVKCKFTPRR